MALEGLSLIHDTYLFITDTPHSSSNSASVSSRSACLARAKIFSTSSSAGSMPLLSSQKITLDFPLADAERGSVYGVRAGREGRERIRYRQAAVRVPVPVQAHVLSAGRYDLLANEAEKRLNAVRRHVAHRVAHHDGPGAALDGRR